MAELNRNHISLIHVAKKELGLNEEEYRALLQQFNVKTSKDLTYAQFERLIEMFEKLGFTSPFLTYRQKTRIKELAKKIYGEDYIEALSKEIVKQTSFDIPLSRLNKIEASKVIISLEKIQEWKKSKGVREHEM
ncbi:phage protein GemA/Gp16 family protein [Fusobacterium necrophorum]|uniref:phage protein GemA/Gp16 family protein n=1 Tax=Fusobacterium necrophorum TaxID=859 RepID=UPI00254BC621|nr:phage protein GemA/Gp16 family protein [Fusobacterium necrophorum]MDK4476163.1 regulatory protein GemA [Fusobacterium necrophorum]